MLFVLPKSPLLGTRSYQNRLLATHSSDMLLVAEFICKTLYIHYPLIRHPASEMANAWMRGIRIRNPQESISSDVAYLGEWITQSPTNAIPAIRRNPQATQLPPVHDMYQPTPQLSPYFVYL
jgi:hypothetical protein